MVDHIAKVIGELVDAFESTLAKDLTDAKDPACVTHCEAFADGVAMGEGLLERLPLCGIASVDGLGWGACGGMWPLVEDLVFVDSDKPKAFVYGRVRAGQEGAHLALIDKGQGLLHRAPHMAFASVFWEATDCMNASDREQLSLDVDLGLEDAYMGGWLRPFQREEGGGGLLPGPAQRPSQLDPSGEAGPGGVKELVDRSSVFVVVALHR